ncbi:hypothetical protein [Streptomyces sp. H34-S4]|uniref:hypothetical protein n=1 Tax=Streptomyces sp. H34-S4 TaxID=2996463 RepID=UPI002271F3E2|nr:hypothetical protein [Streptomyces sp. H34-S4]MCY0937777.1 hypothetical protein [Streptomyces sp. H34-S4]
MDTPLDPDMRPHPTDEILGYWECNEYGERKAIAARTEMEEVLRRRGRAQECGVFVANAWIRVEERKHSVDGHGIRWVLYLRDYGKQKAHDARK